MKLIAVDDGHGMETAGKRTPPFSDGTVMRENEFNRAVIAYLDAALQRCGFLTLLVAPGDDDVPLSTRTELSNNAIRNKYNRPADLYISIHTNAFTGEWQDKARGIETYHYPDVEDGKRAAQIIHSHLLRGTNLPDRGVKTADFYVLRHTTMTAVLVECGFMDNREEAELLRSEAYRKECAEEIVTGICEYFSVEYVPEGQPAGTSIAGSAQSTVEQAQEWARNRGAAQAFIDVAPIYWRLGAEIGIRPEVAYAQAAKETAFGRFGGVVDRSFHNWCGLKTTQGGSNSDPNAHAQFPDDETGVLAHLQHLALYAGVEVSGEIVDPRHFSSIEGTARTVESLGGKWALAADYGQSIVRDYLEGLQQTKIFTPPVDNSVDKEAAEKVIGVLGALWTASADKRRQAGAGCGTLCC
ncbi:N-acetylmuramoyl-L-alanine amidase [Brevibacillus humidisoli]|uniref:N-acetylmuramoyl-L-alanine amidase n=1 Tax=Brevibacillus humidisoli TaxID=2895522 RepID=UPI001E5CC8CE|nr:N-acetylmuramoyl-L-alanine amidase [Brevibacillus humidisoli]UFJ40086.1 N-acetylmuramoyl-L-alanine amidase [Brevibacillus humidisoli]